MTKNIYCCCTYYQLLIAIVKSSLSTDYNSLILEISDNPSRGILKDVNFFQRLEQTGFFSRIYYSEDIILAEGDSVLSSAKRYLGLFIFTRQKKRRFRNILANYDNIFIFNDQNILGRAINNLKQEYILVEDGLNCFKLNQRIIHKKINFKNLLKRILYNNYQLGNSPLIRYIEVNEKNGVKIPNKRIVEVPREALFASLRDSDKRKILRVFGNNLDPAYFNNAILILTQPFTASGQIGTEEEQIMLFKDLCKKFKKCNNGKIILKVHPRDRVDYSSIGGATILAGMFPVELLDMVGDIKLQKVVAVSSTAVHALKCAEEKVTLGWDWLDNWKNEHHLMV